MGAASHLINVTNGDYCISPQRKAESVASVCLDSFEVKANADCYGLWRTDFQLIERVYELLIEKSYCKTI